MRCPRNLLLTFESSWPKLVYQEVCHGLEAGADDGAANWRS